MSESALLSGAPRHGAGSHPTYLHSEYFTMSLICYVDLFPTSQPGQPPLPAQGKSLQQAPEQSTSSLMQRSSTPSIYPHNEIVQEPIETWRMQIDPMLFSTAATPANSVILDQPCTEHLAGEKFVACSLVEYEGSHAPVFVFSVCTFTQYGYPC